MKTPDEADSTEPVLVISLAASERLTDAHACPWTRVEPCVTGLVASFQTLLTIRLNQFVWASRPSVGLFTVSRTLYLRSTVSATAYGDHRNWSDGAREGERRRRAEKTRLMTPVSLGL